MRVLTSTVATSGSVKTRLPVKTDREIPREAIPAAMEEIFKIIIENSVIPGDLISKNLGGTGADLISTGVWDGR